MSREEIKAVVGVPALALALWLARLTFHWAFSLLTWLSHGGME